VPGLLALNGEMKSAITEMLIPRERLQLGQAIGKGIRPISFFEASSCTIQLPKWRVGL